MEIQREETHMRSSAKYRPFEISHVSVGDYFAAMQINLCVRGWIEAFATLAAYAIPISSRTMSFPADLLGGNLRQPPLPKTSRMIALPPPKCNRKFYLVN